jgi:hypothetical protein
MLDPSERAWASWVSSDFGVFLVHRWSADLTEQ